MCDELGIWSDWHETLTAVYSFCARANVSVLILKLVIEKIPVSCVNKICLKLSLWPCDITFKQDFSAVVLYVMMFFEKCHKMGKIYFRNLVSNFFLQ